MRDLFFFFLFAWILPRQERLHHDFLYSLIAQHGVHSGRVHDYMTLLQRAEKGAAGTALQSECDYNHPD